MLGPEGTLTWPGGDPYHDYGATQRHFTLGHGERAADETVTFPGNSLTAAFAKQMDEFIEAAQGNAQPRAGGHEGRQALQLALAVLQSARSGEVVHLK
jgi:predicted dehydrogenase